MWCKCNSFFDFFCPDVGEIVAAFARFLNIRQIIEYSIFACKIGFDAAENEPPHVWGPIEECSWCPHRQRMPLSRRRPCRSNTLRNRAPIVGFVNIGLCNRRHLRCWAGVPTRQSLFQTSVDLFFFHFRVFHFSFDLLSLCNVPPVLEEGQEQRYRAALASLPIFRIR